MLSGYHHHPYAAWEGWFSVVGLGSKKKLPLEPRRSVGEEGKEIVPP